MNPILILLLGAGVWYFMNNKDSATNNDNALDAGYKLQDLIYWGIDGVEKLNENEILVVWEFVSAERRGDHASADKLLSQVKAIAKKYQIVI